MPDLKIQELRKSFDRKELLNIHNLSFPEGIHQIQGANGSGKTTFFNCLSGISPFKGRITLNGHHSNSNDYKFRVNYSQSTPVFPDFLIGAEMINLFARLKKAEASQKDMLIDRFEVNVYQNTPIGTYSSGMLKKLSLVIAFLGNPEWIILDEPFITLDHQAQQTLVGLIDQYSKGRVSFLFATHQDMEKPVYKIDQTYQLENGKLSLNP